MSARYITPDVQESNVSSSGESNKTWKRNTIKTVLSFFVFAIFGALVIAPSISSATIDTSQLSIDDFDNYDDYIAAVSENSNIAEASGIRCAAIGFGMNTTPFGVVDFNTVPHSDANGRKWNIREAYNDGAGHTAYFGEPSGEQNWFMSIFVDDEFATAEGGAEGSDVSRLDEAIDRYEIENLDGDAAAELEDIRGFWRCNTAGLGLVMIPDFLLSISSVISGFASLVADLSFSTNLICQDPENPSMPCINFIALLGGGGNSGDGIIGALTNSIFLPLSVLAFIIVGLTLTWTGLVRREYRKAFGQMGWALGAFAFGLLFLFNPLMIAQAPMAIMNSVSACIIGAFNGANCMSSSNTGEAIDSDDVMTGTECLTEASSLNANQQMSLIVSGLTCNIYMAFVLEPWANNNFGVSWRQLDMDNENIEEALEIAGLDANDFTVNMRSSNGGESFVGNNGASVQNLGAYQLALGTNVSHNSDDGNVYYSGASSGQMYHDLRWYKIIALTHASQQTDANMWEAWNRQMMSRITTGFLSIFASMLGTLVIFVASFFAMIYYIGSAILITFAPLFFLFAIQPTRGRKIFLGWLEMIFSNILKYLASALFLIIAISFYAAVLGTSDGFVTAFLFIILISIALFMYRKEIVELIGRVNMGGEKFSHDALKNAWSKTKDATSSVAGSAAGSMIANRGGIQEAFKDGGIRSGLRESGTALMHGAGAGGSRFLRNQNSGMLGVAGDAQRQFDISKNENERKNQQAIANHENNAHQQARDAEKTASSEESDINQVVNNNTDLQDDYNNNIAGAETDYINPETNENMTAAEAQENLANVRGQERQAQQQTIDAVLNDENISEDDKANFAERHNLNNTITEDMKRKEELESGIAEKKVRLEELQENPEDNADEITQLEQEIQDDEDELKALNMTIQDNSTRVQEINNNITPDGHAAYESNFRNIVENDPDMDASRITPSADRYGELGLMKQSEIDDEKQLADKLDREADEVNSKQQENVNDIEGKIQHSVDAASNRAYIDEFERLKAEKLEENNGEPLSNAQFSEIKDQAQVVADAAGENRRNELQDQLTNDMVGAKEIDNALKQVDFERTQPELPDVNWSDFNEKAESLPDDIDDSEIVTETTTHTEQTLFDVDDTQQLDRDTQPHTDSTLPPIDDNGRSDEQPALFDVDGNGQTFVQDELPIDDNGTDAVPESRNELPDVNDFNADTSQDQLSPDISTDSTLPDVNDSTLPDVDSYGGRPGESSNADPQLQGMELADEDRSYDEIMKQQGEIDQNAYPAVSFESDNRSSLDRNGALPDFNTNDEAMPEQDQLSPDISTDSTLPDVNDSTLPDVDSYGGRPGESSNADPQLQGMELADEDRSYDEIMKQQGEIDQNAYPAVSFESDNRSSLDRNGALPDFDTSSDAMPDNTQTDNNGRTQSMPGQDRLPENMSTSSELPDVDSYGGRPGESSNTDPQLQDMQRADADRDYSDAMNQQGEIDQNAYPASNFADRNSALPDPASQHRERAENAINTAVEGERQTNNSQNTPESRFTEELSQKERSDIANEVKSIMDDQRNRVGNAGGAWNQVDDIADRIESGSIDTNQAKEEIEKIIGESVREAEVMQALGQSQNTSSNGAPEEQVGRSRNTSLPNTTQSPSSSNVTPSETRNQQPVSNDSNSAPNSDFRASDTAPVRDTRQQSNQQPMSNDSNSAPSSGSRASDTAPVRDTRQQSNQQPMSNDSNSAPSSGSRASDTAPARDTGQQSNQQPARENNTEPSTQSQSSRSQSLPEPDRKQSSLPDQRQQSSPSNTDNMNTDDFMETGSGRQSGFNERPVRESRRSRRANRERVDRNNYDVSGIPDSNTTENRSGMYHKEDSSPQSRGTRNLPEDVFNDDIDISNENDDE